MGPVDFNYFLNRKYTLQQQQADAGTTQANAQTIQANAQAANAKTNLLGTEAAAALDRARAGVLPSESAAQVAANLAGARLSNTQADELPRLNTSEIGLRSAQVGLIGAQTNRENINAEGDFNTRVARFGGASPTANLPGIGSTGTFQLSGGRTRRAPRLQDYNRRRDGLNASGLEYVNGF